MKNSFFNQEDYANYLFAQAGTVFHVFSSENHSVVFKTIEDYKVGMTLFALAVSLYPEIKVYTFELMSNHFHGVMAGPKDVVTALMERYFKLVKKLLAEEVMVFNIEPVDDLEYLRNLIVYTNRNGFIVTQNTTPFSYEWGANRFFFNTEAKLRYKNESKPFSARTARAIAQTHAFDSVSGLRQLDGYVSPLSFCQIEEAEQLFRDARSYFARLSRNVEAFRKIAQSIGESIFYTDDDLYSAVCSICKTKYGESRPSLLNASAKTEVAKLMHYDYNASNKQIARILKIDLTTVNALFPITSKNP